MIKNFETAKSHPGTDSRKLLSSGFFMRVQHTHSCGLYFHVLLSEEAPEVELTLVYSGLP